MFVRFTSAAKLARLYARSEATLVKSSRIEPEHLLLGIIIAKPSLLEGILPNRKTPHHLRNEIIAAFPKYQTSQFGDYLPSSQVNKVFAKALSGSGEVDVEHLLIHLLELNDEKWQPFQKILGENGVTTEEVLKLSCRAPA
jgi:ATP-dependent Clp protease ATP-binding subunit ClpA